MTVLRIPPHTLSGYEKSGDVFVSVKDISAWLTICAELADKDGLTDIAKAYRLFRDALNTEREPV